MRPTGATSRTPSSRWSRRLRDPVTGEGQTRPFSRASRTSGPWRGQAPRGERHARPGDGRPVERGRHGEDGQPAGRAAGGDDRPHDHGRQQDRQRRDRRDLQERGERVGARAAAEHVAPQLRLRERGEHRDRVAHAARAQVGAEQQQQGDGHVPPAAGERRGQHGSHQGERRRGQPRPEVLAGEVRAVVPSDRHEQPGRAAVSPEGVERAERKRERQRSDHQHRPRVAAERDDPRDHDHDAERGLDDGRQAVARLARGVAQLAGGGRAQAVGGQEGRPARDQVLVGTLGGPGLLGPAGERLQAAHPPPAQRCRVASGGDQPADGLQVAALGGRRHRRAGPPGRDHAGGRGQGLQAALQALGADAEHVEQQVGPLADDDDAEHEEQPREVATAPRPQPHRQRRRDRARCQHARRELHRAGQQRQERRERRRRTADDRPEQDQRGHGRAGPDQAGGGHAHDQLPARQREQRQAPGVEGLVDAEEQRRAHDPQQAGQRRP